MKAGFPTVDIGVVCAELLRWRKHLPRSSSRTLDVWIESDPDEELLIGIGYVADGTLQDCVIMERAGAAFVARRLMAFLDEKGGGEMQGEKTMTRVTRHNPLTGKDDLFEAEPLTPDERREYDHLRQTPCEELDRTEPGWEARFNALAYRAADESAVREIAAGKFCRECGAIYGDCDCERT